MYSLIKSAFEDRIIERISPEFMVSGHEMLLRYSPLPAPEAICGTSYLRFSKDESRLRTKSPADSPLYKSKLIE